MRKYKLLPYAFILVLLFGNKSSFSQQPKLVLPIGHTQEITSASFSPDDKTVITVSNKFVKIWDTESGKLLHTIDASSKYGFNDAEYNPDGHSILTSSFDSPCEVWDVQNGTRNFSLPDISQPGTRVDFSPDGKFILATPKILNAKNGKFISKIEGLEPRYSPNGKLIAAGNIDSSISFFTDDGSKTLLRVNKQGNNFFWKCVFSPDSRSAAVIGNSIRVYNLQIPALRFEIPDKSIKFLRFSPDGKTFSTLSEAGEIKIWDLLAGKLINKRLEDSTVIYDITYSPNSKNLFIRSQDSLARILDVSSGKLISSIHVGPQDYEPLRFNPEGSLFLSLDNIHDRNGTDHFYVNVWDAQRQTILMKLDDQFSSTFGTYFSHDGKKIVTFYQNGNAIIWNSINGKLISTLTNHISSTNQIAYSQTNDTIFSISTNNSICYWDSKTLKLKAIVNNFDKNYQPSGTFMLNGKMVYLAYKDSILEIWELKTNSLLKKLQTSFLIGAAKLSADGKILIITSFFGRDAMYWNTENFTPPIKLLTPFMAAGVALSSDSKKLIFIPYTINDTSKYIVEYDIEKEIYTAKFSFIESALTDPIPVYDSLGNVLTQRLITNSFSVSGNNEFFFQTSQKEGKIFDLKDGKHLMDLTGINEKIVYSAFNESSKMLFTSGNGKARIWDVKTGAMIMKLNGENFIKQAIFSADNKFVVTLSTDNQVKKWSLGDGELLYSFFRVDSTDKLVIDKYGRFDGTQSARKLLYFTCGTEIIELDQLKEQLWVTDLAERIEKGDSINAKTLSDMNICGLTPQVETLKDNGLQYQFKITPRRGGLGETVLFINGIEAKRYKRMQLKTSGTVYTLMISKDELKNYFISGQENAVTIKAYTADNSISSRGIIVKEDNSKQSAALPNLYGVMVGVSDYKGSELDLKYAAKDATDLSSAISLAARKLLNNTDGKEHVFMYNLTTANERYMLPEKNAIKIVLEEISKKAVANDILLIFFAGHGMTQSEKKQFYFLTSDASQVSAIDATADVGISTNELTDWIKPQNIKAQKRILILDACNGGQVIKDFVTIGKAGQDYISARSDDKPQQVKAIDRLNEKSGLFILCASASDQNAYELGKYSQGLLTYALLKAIKMQPDILEDGKLLNLSRWFNAAEKTVSELSKENNARQEPQIVTNTNFNIGIVDDEVTGKIILPQQKPLFTGSNFQNSDENIADDNLYLTKAINRQFSIASRRAENNIEYSDAADLAGSYSLTGRYDIKGEDIIVKVNLKQDKEIRYRFEIKEKKDSIDFIAGKILEQVEKYIQLNSK